MVDSVGSMSVYGASDELTDPFCDICFKDNTIRPVAGYCPKCVEFYCQSCVTAHRRMSVSERHKILKGPDMPACQADKPVKYQRCDKHDGEGKDKYCFDHGIIICGICFKKEHKQCQVKEVSEASKSFNMAAEKKYFSADVSSLLKHVKETSQSIKANKAGLEKKKQDILTEAQNQRYKLLENVNQSFQDFSGEVTSLFTDYTTTLSARQSALDEIVTEVAGILQSLQQSGTKKQNDRKEFLELQYSAEQVRLCEEKIKLLNLKHIDIICIFNTNIQPLSLTRNKLGELSLQSSTFQYSTECQSVHYPIKGPRQDPHKTAPKSGAIKEHAVQSNVKLAPLGKINVKIPCDKEDCWISGIDVTVDGNMLLVDNANCTIKLFSPHGLLLSSLKLPEKPVDVGVINKSEAAISMDEKQIGIIGINKSSHLSLKRVINTMLFVGGITAYNNNLIVTCKTCAESPSSIQMLDMKGKILWTTANDSDGKNLFEYARFLKTRFGDDGDTLIVTDREKYTITALDAGSGKVVKMCDVEGKEPRGLTVDGNGNVYVCYLSGDITVWSRDMQEETGLTTESKYVKYSWAMAYNSRRSELVLTSRAVDTNYCDFIHRFKISVT